MNISTNSFGNYKPIAAQQNKNTPKAESKNIIKEAKVTNEEKQFFTKLYPEEKESITSYHFYNKQGDKNGVSIGSLFDKRG